MDNRRRQGSPAIGAGELPPRGGDGGGHGAGRHLHSQPLHAHTHQDHAEEAQLPGENCFKLLYVCLTKLLVNWPGA